MNELDKQMDRLVKWWPHPVKQIAADTWLVTLATPDVEMIEVCMATLDSRNTDHLAAELRRWLVGQGWRLDIRTDERGTILDAINKNGNLPWWQSMAPTELLAVLTVANDVALEGKGE